jgi:hypothetical protein
MNKKYILLPPLKGEKGKRGRKEGDKKYVLRKGIRGFMDKELKMI